MNTFMPDPDLSLHDQAEILIERYNARRRPDQPEILSRSPTAGGGWDALLAAIVDNEFSEGPSSHI